MVRALVCGALIGVVAGVVLAGVHLSVGGLGVAAAIQVPTVGVLCVHGLVQSDREAVEVGAGGRAEAQREGQPERQV